MFMSFRQHQRDQTNDDRRILSVKQALASAIASVDQEFQGLSLRVQTARNDAGSLLGSEDGLSAARSEEDERYLRAAELQLMSGLQRLSRLQQVASVLRDLDARLALFEACGAH